MSLLLIIKFIKMKKVYAIIALLATSLLVSCGQAEEVTTEEVSVDVVTEEVTTTEEGEAVEVTEEK